jgi:hypothetical protein
VIDCSRNHASRDKRLTQSDLIRDEKASRRFLAVEPLENVIHRRTLEVLEAGENGSCIGPVRHFDLTC